MTITRMNPEYTPKDFWEGFTHSVSQNWGVQTGTFVNGLFAANGSAMAFRRDCPSNGKLSFVIDGKVYVDEGANMVATTSQVSDLVIARRYEVTATPPSSAGSMQVSITAGTVSGYKFLCWVHVATRGWIGSAYIEKATDATANIWVPKSVWDGAGSKGFAATALYIRNI